MVGFIDLIAYNKIVLLEEGLQCSGNEKLVLIILGGFCVSKLYDNYLLISTSRSADPQALPLSYRSELIEAYDVSLTIIRINAMLFLSSTF
jgi:hypothetical protein